jgi:hypothetical protein
MSSTVACKATHARREGEGKRSFRFPARIAHGDKKLAGEGYDVSLAGKGLYDVSLGEGEGITYFFLLACF